MRWVLQNFMWWVVTDDRRLGGVLLRGDKFRKKVLEQVAGSLYLSCVEADGSPKPHDGPEQSAVPEESGEWEDKSLRTS